MAMELKREIMEVDRKIADKFEEIGTMKKYKKSLEIAINYGKKVDRIMESRRGQGQEETEAQTGGQP